LTDISNELLRLEEKREAADLLIDCLLAMDKNKFSISTTSAEEPQKN